jgi:ParD-like antitoxin of type II ParDE toxin-antitoxin system
MPAPVKISDRLLARAKAEAKGAHRSVTAQIEHWATLGRAVEMLAGHGQVLALKRAGTQMTMPPYAGPQEVHDVLTRLINDPDREAVKTEIRAAGTPLYGADPDDPDGVIQIAPDGRRTRGRFQGHTFVPRRDRAAVRVAARRRR